MSLITWFKERLFCDLAIDLGTANTLVYLRGKGIIVQEPSLVVVNRRTGGVEAVGSKAKEMLGKTPNSVLVIKPMRDGVIADFEIAEKMLDYFIKKSTNSRSFLLRPRIVIGIPTGITQVERRAVKDVALRAKASEVYLIEQPMSASIGADLPISEPTGNMIVDVGGGTTDIAVISMNGIVYNHSIRIAGNEMDEAIIQHIKKKYNLLIGEKTAEQVKMQIGSAYPLDEPMTLEIKGRDLREGIPKTIVVDDQEMREAIEDVVAAIIEAIKISLEKTPPELSADIIDRGIIITGGGSLLKNLDKRVREETQLPVFITEDPLTTVVLGAGKMLDDLDLLRKISLI
jgi:rod shape-determining protein MreB and related proteins